MKIRSSLRSRALLAAGVAIAILVIDQVIKIAVKTSMWVGERIDILPWFKIQFVENRGMAFGVDFVGTVALALFRVVAIGVLVYFLRNLVRNGAKHGLIACWAAVTAGATGNIIDNCLYGLIFTESGIGLPPVAQLVPLGEGYGEFLSGKVVDMFYFPLFTWPESWPLIGGDVFFGAIFNFADAAISCGAVAMLLFYSRGNNGNILLSRPKGDVTPTSGADAANKH